MFRFYNTRVGAVAHVPSDTCIRAALETYGEWAHMELSVLRLLTRRGDTVFDVGANVGYHTLAFARFVGPLGRVLAFEPNPEAFRLANLTVSHNDARNVELHQALVGRSAGQASFERVDIAGNLGASRFRAPGPTAGRNRVTLGTVRLDDFGDLVPDLIKIDVEGMQFEVLEGAAQLIATVRPLIFLEANGEADLRRAQATLGPRGYRIVQFTAPAFNPANARGETHDIFGGAVEDAVVAVPDEKVDDVASRHPFLAQLIEGGRPDWMAFPGLLDWGKLRPWRDVHALNQALAPMVARRESSVAKDRPRVFLHIPKTAGTALTEAIKPLFGAAVQAYFPKNPFVPEGYDVASLSFAQGSLIHGHFQLVDRFLQAKEASFLTVLRDPLDRAVSEFVHGIDRNMATSFGDTLRSRRFDYGRSAEFDLAAYMTDGRNRLFFTNTHLRYLGALGTRPVHANSVSETIGRLQGLEFVFAALPTLEADVATWLGAERPPTLRQTNTRERIRAGDLFCQDSLDALYEANAADFALLRRLRPDAFSERQVSSVPSKAEEMKRLAEVFARYRPKEGVRG